MRSSLRTIALTLVALATAVAGTTPAAAGSGPPPYKVTYYKWLSCSDGTASTASITYARAHTTTEGVDVYWAELHGAITTCRAADTPYAYALAMYGNGYGSGEGFPYAYSNSLAMDYANFIRIYPDVQAVCVIANETTRMACVSVDWVPAEAGVLPVIGGPLPTDSPRVDVPAVTDLSVETGGPVPPGCMKCG
ncbi:hypothetical protein AB0B66_28295 [Catellatospora sp. NPDC049111]|uniref:hypothetical protein n=1 Tax=Catellatospora sp. NPDC049111 TaxID=3155271 RepID=UPI00341197A7